MLHSILDISVICARDTYRWLPFFMFFVIISYIDDKEDARTGNVDHVEGDDAFSAEYTSPDGDRDDEADILSFQSTLPHQCRPTRSYDRFGCPTIIVVDVSGVHVLRLRPCKCLLSDTVPLVDQLLSMGLYPASTKRTRTVFTFRVLDDYDLENLETKASAAKYYEKLKRLTSNAFPQTVPDRYRELMRVSRQWRDLKVRQRAGEPFSPSDAETPGSLALFCPACPQPGVNLPEQWQQDPDRYGKQDSVRSWF